MLNNMRWESLERGLAGLRSRGCGFEPYRRHSLMSLSKSH